MADGGHAGATGRGRPATLRARVIVDELVRAGLTELCIAPGSRSTPLVLAALEHSALRARVFIDERSAAFFASGWARATGRPAAVLTTSGTAVANLFPAVVEACQGEVPLLLLTADRPPRLRDADANQAIDQLRIFGSYVRYHADLVGSVDDAASVRHLRASVQRAFSAAAGWPAGPVHLNVPFDKPLEPAGDEPPPPPARAGGAPWLRLRRAPPRAPDDALDELGARVAAAERPLLVGGPTTRASEVGPALRALAASGGIPLVADPLSGGRYGHDPRIAAPVHYDLFLREAAVRAALQPDLVVRVGAAPTSATVAGWLESLVDIHQVVVDAGPRFKDHLAVAADYGAWDASDALLRLSERVTPRADGSWPARWVAVDEASRAALAALDVDPSDEGRLMADVVRALPDSTTLFVSSSMPVRDLDAFGGPHRDLVVYGNRGASGIDGIVSSALGVAAGSASVVVAVVGDLALLHDVNGLLATREPDARVVFVVVNNDGGGIFHFLPVREHEPAFTPYFATPHGIEPGRAAALYGVPHRRLDDRSELAGAIAAALGSGRSAVLEIRTDREANRQAHRRATEAVTAAAKAALDLANG